MHTGWGIRDTVWHINLLPPRERDTTTTQQVREEIQFAVVSTGFGAQSPITDLSHSLSTIIFILYTSYANSIITHMISTNLNIYTKLNGYFSGKQGETASLCLSKVHKHAYQHLKSRLIDMPYLFRWTSTQIDMSIGGFMRGLQAEGWALFLKE